MKKLLLLIACVVMFVGCSEQTPNTDIDPPVVDNTPSLTVDFQKDKIGVNQKLGFNITAEDKANVSIKVFARDNEGWNVRVYKETYYTPTTVGDKTLVFTAVGSTNDSVVVTKKITVEPCDFMFGIWGDNQEDIIKHEDGLKDSGLVGYWLNYRGGNVFKTNRSYHFQDDNLLSKGMVSTTYTVLPNDPAFVTKMLLLTDAWKAQIAALTKVFGAPTSNTFPIEFDLWSRTKQVQYIQLEIEKTKAVFKNIRTEVVAQIHYYGNSNLSFKTETIYSRL